MKYIIQIISVIILSISFLGCGKKVVPIVNKYNTDIVYVYIEKDKENYENRYLGLERNLQLFLTEKGKRVIFITKIDDKLTEGVLLKVDSIVAATGFRRRMDLRFIIIDNKTKKVIIEKSTAAAASFTGYNYVTETLGLRMSIFVDIYTGKTIHPKYYKRINKS